MADHVFIAKKIKNISRKEVDFLFSKLNAEEKLKGKETIFIKPNLFAPEESKTGATVNFNLISHVVDHLNERGKKVYMGEVGAHQYDSEKLFRDMKLYDRFDVEFINLNFTEFKEVFFEIFDQKATPVQIATFLTALSLKGESEEEIVGAALVVREKATKIQVKSNFLGIEQKEPIFDTCGTGGSGVNKFNISTAVAFVVSALGVKVAKHGNRSASGRSGSADVLEEMRIKIDAQFVNWEDE